MKNEKKILASFSIAPSEKAELLALFDYMGLSWASGVRMALKEFQRNHTMPASEEARSSRR